MKNIEAVYPLSSLQQGMLFHSLYAPAEGMYVECASFILRNEVDPSAFQAAWQRVLDRHAILRTGFVWEGVKEPVQVVHRQAPLPFELLDWRDRSPQAQQAALEAYLQSSRAAGFDLTQPPLMRVALMRISEDAYYFVWVHHHILLDGWSVPIMLSEVLAFYDAAKKGVELSLKPPRPFRDYIVWLKRQDISACESFWRRSLAGFSAATPLPIKKAAPQIELRSEKGSEASQPGETGFTELKLALSEAQTTLLNTLARQHQLTLNTLVQAAWALLLSRYSGEADVVYGATMSGRPVDLPGAETMLGLFINTLPVRVRIDPQQPLLAWLKALQSYQAELRQYEWSPLAQVQGWSEVPRGLPLFETLLVFENLPVSAVAGQPAVTGQPAASGEVNSSLRMQFLSSEFHSNLPLSLVVGPGKQLVLRVTYDRSLFHAQSIERLLGHLQTILEGFTAGLDRPVSAIGLLTPAEQRRLLVEWNNTAAPFPSDVCAHQLFEAQAAATPEAIALAFRDQRLTYAELNRRANQLAHYLQKAGVGPETLVGICVERSPDMVIGLLGIMKAGGAYLPLDPAYPPDRLAFMLADAGSAPGYHLPVVLTQRRLQDRLPAFPGRVVCLDEDWPAIAQSSDANPSVGVGPHNLAYIIYTSGSTGRPKGVLLQHQGLCNLVHAQTRGFGVTAADRVLQFASFSFDASISEVCMALLTGATLYLASQETLTSIPDLLDLLLRERITTLTLPPSLLQILSPEDLPDLRILISAGERCPLDVAARWSVGRRFFNAYGPTENTVGPTFYPVERLPEGVSSVPIGRPIGNTRIYLLDGERHPVPVGVPGELYIGGVGVARGYLNRPELTAERFIPDPFLPPGAGQSGERLFRTGDLGRYLPDSAVSDTDQPNIEYLGRVDDQVKLRGYRIELGEIEGQLARHPALQAAVVVVREDLPGQRQLVAYGVPQPAGEAPPPGPSELRAYLQERLPEWMIPAVFISLAELPLTPNGKVDRRALAALPAPDQARPDLAATFVAPRDGLEVQLALLWEGLLNVRPIGVQDDFFELGGHSLLAIRLVAQLQQQFNRHVSLATLFEARTIERLADLLRSQSQGQAIPSLVPLKPAGSRPPLFFIHPSGGSVHWYADLAAHLDPEQPFYALQTRGVNGDQPIHTRIEEMAAHYISEIRSVQPGGPYHLGSWSMGVIIAFEMAQQLVAQGEQVAFLAMLDQGPVSPGSEPEDDAQYLIDFFGKRLPIQLEDLRKLEPEAQVAFVLDAARQASYISPDISLAQFRHFVTILKTHAQAWRRYELKPYPGCVTVFRTAVQPPECSQERDLGWSHLAARVEVYAVPGDHNSMLHYDHVPVLAAAINLCIQSCST